MPKIQQRVGNTKNPEIMSQHFANFSNGLSDERNSDYLTQAEELYAEAISIIKKNVPADSEKSAWELVKALKILINANDIVHSPSKLKIQILSNMAVCQFYIGDNTIAYNVAIIAQKEFEKLYGKFSCEMQEPEELSMLKELIIQITKKEGCRPAELMEHYVLHRVETMYIRKKFPPCNNTTFTGSDIKKCLAEIRFYEQLYMFFSIKYQDRTSKNLCTIMHGLQMPLYFIWQKYKFGRDEEIWKEDESMMDYHIFISNLNDNLNSLIDLLETNNLFQTDKKPSNQVLTNKLLEIYYDLRKRLAKGEI